MGRSARIILPHFPHHIVQRGHNKQDIFRDDGDKGIYLDLVKIYLDQCNCTLMAYCLMSNHVHLLVRPADRESLIKFLHGVGFRYAMHFNKSDSRSGALWENRYHSSIIEEEPYMWRAARYICLNPVDAGLVSNPCDYRWSSAQDLLDGRPNGVPLENWMDEKQRLQFKEIVLDPLERRNIEDACKRGVPYTSPAGLKRVERKLGIKFEIR